MLRGYHKALAAGASLPLPVKVCYGAGSFAKAIQGQAISVYLLFFYTDALGLEPGLAANIVFWGRIWDILNDPLVGIMVDRAQIPGGTCRAYLRRFFLPASALLALCFIVPELSDTVTIVWIILAYVVQAWTSTLIQIPMNTLLGRLTQDKKQRASLNQISLFFSLAANYLITAYVLPFLTLFGSNLRRGYMFLGLVFGIIYALCCLAVVMGTRGRETEEAITKSTVSRHTSASWKSLIQNKIWLCIIVLYTLFTMSTVLESSAMVYYYQYVLHKSSLMTSYSTVSTACSCLIFLSLPAVVKRLGNSGVLGVGCVSYMLGHLLRFFLHDRTIWILLVGWILANLGLSLISSTIILNVFDAKVYGEWKTGIRHDALLMSGFTVSSSLGMAFGSAMVGWLLDLVPYVEQAVQQASQVEQLLFLLNTLVPACLVGLSLLFVVPIIRNERHLPHMYEEIRKRNLQKGTKENNTDDYG